MLSPTTVEASAPQPVPQPEYRPSTNANSSSSPTTRYDGEGSPLIEPVNDNSSSYGTDGRTQRRRNYPSLRDRIVPDFVTTMCYVCLVLEVVGDAVRAEVAALKMDIRSTSLNILLVLAPLAIVSGALLWNATIVFVLNFLALIPLAESTTSIARMPLGNWRVGSLIIEGAARARSVPLIIGIICVIQGQIRILQSFVVGIIIYNILLGIGSTSILGYSYPSQTFDSTSAGVMVSLLVTISSPFIIYAADSFSGLDPASEDAVLFLSHATAIVILLLYGLWLYFRLYSHADRLFNTDRIFSATNQSTALDRPRGYSLSFAVLALAASIVCAYFLVASAPVFALATDSAISRTFIGLVLLPIPANLANHLSCVRLARAGNMRRAVEQHLSDSLYMNGFVLPVLSLVGWVAHRPISMHFQLLEIVILEASIGGTAIMINMGKTNYFTGIMSVGMYAIVVLTYVLCPEDSNT